MGRGSAPVIGVPGSQSRSGTVRAELLMADVRAQMAPKLWRAALGEVELDATPAEPTGASAIGKDGADHWGCVLRAAESEVRLADIPPAAGTRGSAAPARVPPAQWPTPALARVDESASGRMASVVSGPNRSFGAAIAAAAERTGLPPGVIVSTIESEAATSRDGRWNPMSRNPRSSAAGLGQFLSGTWLDLAQQPGSWLNQQAQARGWIDGRGRILPDARSAVLALRYDADASIQSIADFARANLNRMRAAGVAVGRGEQEMARMAYLAHHLGVGDALRFARGGMGEARARTLLNAQIGAGRAAAAISAADGSAALAHRQWLNRYIDRRIGPAQAA